MKISKIGVAKIAFPVMVLIVAVLGCAAPRQSGEQRTPTPTPRASKLEAEVGLSERGVLIRNVDTFDFDLKAKINLRQTGGDDGEAFATVPKGKTVTIPYGEFTVDTARFSPARTKILTIFLKSGDASRLFLCPGAKCVPAS